MTSNAKTRCLLIVFLPGCELARFPDQMARFNFLNAHFDVCRVIASSKAGVAGSEKTDLLASHNPLIFSAGVAARLLRTQVDYDFIYIIGLPAVIAFSLLRPRRPVLVYAPTHFEQHFGLGPGAGFGARLVANLKRRLFFAGLKRMASVMVISRQLQTLYEGRTRRVLMIPMGVDLSLYHARVPPQGDGVTLNIVYAGSGGAGRGIDLIVGCAQKMLANQVDAVFHLIGCNDALLDEAIENNPELSKIIHRHAAMPYASVIRMYETMDVGISLLEPNKFYSVCPPQKIFEYMASGLPIVCNDIATHTDYVGDSAIVIGYDVASLFTGLREMHEQFASYAAAAEAQRGKLDVYSHLTVERFFLDEVRRQLAG